MNQNPEKLEILKWTEIALQVMSGKLKKCDPSTQASMLIGFRPFASAPLFREAIDTLEKMDHKKGQPF